MPDETPPAPVPMRVPHHGRGRLKTGGVHPNSGRRPYQLRERALGSLEQRLDVLDEIADGAVKVPLRRACEHCGKAPTHKPKRETFIKLAPSANERVAAIRELVRIGLGDHRVPAEAVRQRLVLQREVIEDVLEPEDAARLLKALRAVWR